MEKKVIIFTKKDCTWCNKMKGFLDSCEIEFEEKTQTPENDSEVKEISAKLGMKDVGYPTTLVKIGESTYIVRGFNTKEFKDHYFKA